MKDVEGSSAILCTQLEHLRLRYDALQARFESLMHANKIELRTRAHGKFLASIEVVHINETPEHLYARMEHDYAQQLLQLTKQLRVSEKGRIAIVSSLELERAEHKRSKEDATKLQGEVDKLKAELQKVQRHDRTAITTVQDGVQEFSMPALLSQRKLSTAVNSLQLHQLDMSHRPRNRLIPLTGKQKVTDKNQGVSCMVSGYTAHAPTTNLPTRMSPLHSSDPRHTLRAAVSLESIISGGHAASGLGADLPLVRTQIKRSPKQLPRRENDDIEAFFQHLTRYAGEVLELAVHIVEVQPFTDQDEWHRAMTCLTGDLKGLNDRGHRLQLSNCSINGLSDLQKSLVPTICNLRAQFSRPGRCFSPKKTNADVSHTFNPLDNAGVILPIRELGVQPAGATKASPTSNREETVLVRKAESLARDVSNIDKNDSSDSSTILSDTTGPAPVKTSPPPIGSTSDDSCGVLGAKTECIVQLASADIPTSLQNVEASLISPPLLTSMSWIPPNGTHDSIMKSPSGAPVPHCKTRMSDRNLHQRIRRTRRLRRLRLPKYDLDVDEVD